MRSTRLALGGPLVSFAGLAVVVALACGPVTAPSPFAAPMNACPANPCSAYVQTGAAPVCVDGACVVPSTIEDLVIVVSLPDDAYLAPGRTYVALLGASASASSASWACPPVTCAPPLCQLPEYVVDTASYLVAPQAAVGLWNLGNVGLYTALPGHATYRFLWGPSMTEAKAIGLPVPAVSASLVPENGAPGPGGATGLGFQAILPPGCYVRTLQPDAPFSSALPPNVKVLQAPLLEGGKALSDKTEKFEPTTEEPEFQRPTVPTFTIARAEGLDGWTAYLRDASTGRIVSNVASMQGASSRVVLPTNRVQPVAIGLTAPDPLVGLALVVAPPSSSPIPTEVLVPTADILPEHESFPSLPPPATLTGRVSGARPDGGATGVAVAADVVFTATDIVDASGKAYPPNFEFTTRVRTAIDARTGASTYTATLPLGDYQVVVQPLDATSAMRTVTMAVRASAPPSAALEFGLDPRMVVRGNALVTDGRALAQASVDALPTQCPMVPGAQPSAQPPPLAPADPPSSCLPRASQGVTDRNGSFALSLDPGGYLLRVRPEEGSRLPWVQQPIVVVSAAQTGLTEQTVGTVRVPAPAWAGLRLTDSVAMGNPIVNAVVGVFSNPASGLPAVELGQAMTDSHGQYEMYIAPPSP